MKTLYFILLTIVSITVYSQTPKIIGRTYDASMSVGFDTKQWESWTYNNVYNGTSLKLPFRLLKPKNYDSLRTTKYPLIIFFHGRGEKGTDNNYQLLNGGGIHQNAVNMVNGVTFPGFVVFPQEPYGSWVNDNLYSPNNQLSSALSMSLELIDSLILKYNVDPDRIYTHGLSAGGSAAWGVLYHQPQKFAACLPMSTAGDTSQAKKIASIPIWLSQGGIDTNPIPYYSYIMMAALRAAGAIDTNVTRYTEYPGQGHNIWNNTYNNKDFFPFMLRQSKRNIMIMGYNNICPGSKVDLAISNGFANYQWFLNSNSIAGANTSILKNVSISGIYQAAFKRTTVSGWTYTTTVNINTVPASAKPTIKVDNSLVLPSPSGSKVVLTGPDGQKSYQWSNGATSQIISANNTGLYSLIVTPNYGCKSLASDQINVRVGLNGASAPNAPNDLKAYPISNVGIIVRWTDNASNETGYEIYRSNQKGGPYTFVTVIGTNSLIGSNTMSYVNNGLIPITTYYYKVRAINNSGGTTSLEEVRATTGKDFIAPTPPTNLKLAGFTPTKLTLSWNPSFDSTGIKRYHIYNRDTLIGYSDTTIYSISTATGIGKSSMNNYRILAEDNGGNLSAPSNEVPFIVNGQGLFVTYYEGAWGALPNFDATRELKNGIATNATVGTGSPIVLDVLNTVPGFELTNKSTNFGVKFEGYIRIPGNSSNATYTFYTTSDDGSKLWINNTLVVDNDGSHGMQEHSSTYTFPQSANTIWYPIRVGFFQGSGGYGLTTAYQCSGCNTPLAKKAFPVDQLSYLASGSLTSPQLNYAIPPTSQNLSVSSVNFYKFIPNDKPRVKVNWYWLSTNGTSAPVANRTFTGTNFAMIRGFEIYRVSGTGTPNLNSPWSKIASVSNITVSPNLYQFVDTTETPGKYLTLGQTYWYAIKAISDKGNTRLLGDYKSNGFTTFAKVFIPNTTSGILAIPSKLTTSGVSNSIINLTWQDNSNNESGFEVWRSYTKNGIYIKVLDVFRGTTMYNDSTCEAYTKYVYKVRAYNHYTFSGFSLEDSTNTLNVPTAPSGLKAMVVGPNQVNLTWKNNTDLAYGYSIWRSTSLTSGFVQIDAISNPDLKSYQDKTALANIEQYYRIKAFNDFESTFSNADSATTLLSAAINPNWKLAAVSVTGTFDSTLMSNALNQQKMINALLTKKDFLNFLVVTATGTSSLAIKLPPIDSMPRGGLLSFNIAQGVDFSKVQAYPNAKRPTPPANSFQLNLKGDTIYNFLNTLTGVISTAGLLFLDVDNSISSTNLKFTISIGGINGDTTTWQKVDFNQAIYSNYLNKIDLPSTFSGRWLKITLNNTNYVGSVTGSNYFITELGLYKFLPPGIRHNYFLLLGASIEQQKSPLLGLTKFRERLANAGYTDGNTALIFNVKAPPGAGPGTNSIQLSTGINDILDSHPFADFIMVHQGGNNINSTFTGMRPLTYDMFETKPDVKNFINSFIDIYTKILARGKFPLVSRMSFRDYKELTCTTPHYLDVQQGKRQQFGSLPFNLLLDSLCKVYAPFAYNEAEKRNRMNFYAVTLRDQTIMGGDGIHPNQGGATTDKLADYWVNYGMQFAYSNSLPTPLLQTTGPNNPCIDKATTYQNPPCLQNYFNCGLPPASKPGLMDSVSAAMALAKRTVAGKDIWFARTLVEQIAATNIRIPYVDTLDNLRDYRTPTNPSGLSAFIISRDSVNLTWFRNSLNNSGFELYRANTLIGTNYNFKRIAVITTSSTLNFIDSGLSADTLYYYYVQAINGTFKSGWSNIEDVRPSSTYYLAATGDLTDLNSWGKNPDGSGGKPNSFFSSGQSFVVANRGGIANLTSDQTISGKYSKVIVSNSNHLMVNPGVSFNATVDVESNAKLSLLGNTNPGLGIVDTNSTISFGNSATIPSKTYGNINFVGCGNRYIPAGKIDVFGDISLDPDITVNGSNSTLILHNTNIAFGSSSCSLNDISINIVSKNSEFDGKSGIFNLNNLTINGLTTLSFINSSNLLVGANGGNALQINSGSVLDIKNGNLSIVGNAVLNPNNQNPGVIKSSGGSFYFNTNGSSNHNMLFDSEANNVKDLKMNLASSNTALNILSSIYISNTIKLSEGILNSNNYITLISNSLNTARIAKVEPNATITGQITSQRYVGPFKKSSYYMLGTPIWNQQISTWQSFFSLHGFVKSVGAVAIKASTINSWSESRNGWLSIRDSTSLIMPGKGYRAYIKTQNLSPIDSSGFYANTGIPVIGNGFGNNSGQFVIPITKSSLGRGCNVIANPYPSEIDWDSPIGWDKSNIDNTYYVWDGANRVYKSYVSAGGTGLPSVSSNGMSSIINSGQGFLVIASVMNNSSISMSEDVKVESTSLPNFYRIGGEQNVFRIFLNNLNNQADEAILRFTDNSSLNFDRNLDALKLEGDNLNISVITPLNESLAINSIPNRKTNIIPLSINSVKKGQHYLNFQGIDNLNGIRVFLVDDFLKKTEEISGASKVYFTITDDSLSFGKNRFQLIFQNNSFSEPEKSLFVFQNFPNPVSETSTLKFILPYDNNVNIEILNMLGNVIYKHSQMYFKGTNTMSLNFSDSNLNSLGSGIYFFRISACGESDTKRFSILRQ